MRNPKPFIHINTSVFSRRKVRSSSRLLLRFALLRILLFCFTLPEQTTPTCFDWSRRSRLHLRGGRSGEEPKTMTHTSRIYSEWVRTLLPSCKKGFRVEMGPRTSPTSLRDTKQVPSFRYSGPFGLYLDSGLDLFLS